MSMAASAWAKRQQTGSASRKAVLMVLADYASSIEDLEPPGADGRHYAWPGRARLVGQSEVSERTLIRCIADLEEAGFVRSVRRHDRDGHRMSDVVILAVDDAGDRPFDHPVETVDDDQVPDWHVGAKVPTATGQGANGDNRSSIGTTKEPPSSKRARATRVPDPFIPDESLRSWYREKIGARIDGVAEHEKFMDYFRAAPGQKGLKQDWPGTWRNWMRNALERSGRRPGAATSETPRYPSAQERNAAALDREADIARVAEAIVESRGGDPESFTEVSPVMARLKAEPALLEVLLPVLAVPVSEQAALLQGLLQGLQRQHEQNGSASRTSDMYSGGNGYIDGQVTNPREVTGHASE